MSVITLSPQIRDNPLVSTLITDYPCSMWTYQHGKAIIHQLPVLQDNYIYLIEAADDQTLAVVDPAEAAPVIAYAKHLGKAVTHILNTHHHWDHTDGNLDLLATYNCQIFGAAHDAARIAGITQPVSAGKLQLGSLSLDVLDVPGHTLGHIAYVLNGADTPAMFCGDVLFGAGCGRIFEGTAAQMLQSLMSLVAHDGNTRVYCAHEYTLANLSFAQHIQQEFGSDAPALTQRIARDLESRHQQQPTIPSTLADEMATNPFLRVQQEAFIQAYARTHHVNADALSVFTDLRTRRNNWKQTLIL